MNKNMLTQNLQSLYKASPTPMAPPTTPAPATIAPQSVSANSTSTPALGVHPDFSGMTPEQMGALTRGLSNLTYSVAGGGYVFRNDANNANSYYNKFGGSDPAANRAAANLYGEIGALPTVANMTGALTKLYGQTGQKPAQGPSFNDTFASRGLEGPYGGPYETPDYHPFRNILSRYGM